MNPPHKDEDICRMIRKKLESYGRISYLEIARAAYSIGRRKLATMILDLEQTAAKQVCVVNKFFPNLIWLTLLLFLTILYIL